MLVSRFFGRTVAVGAISGFLILALLLTLRTPMNLASRRIANSTLDELDAGSLKNVFNGTLGFEKIFVISLAERTDQRDSMALAASLTGLDVTFVEGVTDVNHRALPPGSAEADLNPGSLRAWRAHMNVIRTIVEQNITSALVLEGDIDWDVRIKSQMRHFALASRLLLQPRAGTSDEFLDPTYPGPSSTDAAATNLQVRGSIQQTVRPSTSPYADIWRWDLLWLGHCGVRFPYADDDNPSPLGRAVLAKDGTVPEQQHLDMQFGNDDLLNEYPAHTRVVSHARMSTCTLAYAVSQPGARKVLYELAINKLSGTNDMQFRSICHGSEGRPRATCLTVQPQLFQHHRPAGSRSGFSDINDFGDDENQFAFTRNIRWSARVNMQKMIKGSTDYFDQYRDGDEAPAWVHSR